jgi:uncharacterized protein
MAGKFVLQKSKTGQYFFDLRAGNGERIAQSEMYTTKAAAKDGIASVKKNASDAETDDHTREG